jgi:hypothetical protein
LKTLGEASEVHNNAWMTRAQKRVCMYVCKTEENVCWLWRKHTIKTPQRPFVIRNTKRSLINNNPHFFYISIRLKSFKKYH